MLQGVSLVPQQCHEECAPNFLQGVMLRTQQCHTSITSKGSISASRQRHFSHAPTNFIWCQLRIAEMPIEQRTKGRVIWGAQKCQPPRALPNQFNGVIVKTQKCLDIVAPRGEPRSKRRYATVTSLSPTILMGTLT